IALMKILILAPQPHGSGVMHNGLDITAQVAHQVGIVQITLDKLGTTAHQVFHTFSASPVDPHVQALLQGETRKAPADEAACAGDQNFHGVSYGYSCKL